MRSTIALLVFVLTVLAVVVLSAMNQQPMNVWFMGFVSTLPVSILVFAGVVLGSVAVMSLMKVRKNNPAYEAKRLSSWQEQDNKLVAEIKSDREKQLEAKVSTLEAALKSTLKKN